MSPSIRRLAARTCSALIATCALGLSADPAQATPETEWQARAPIESHDAQGEPGLGEHTAPGAPLPRFTVGWYCPPPDGDPLRQLIGFGLGVVLIWGVAAHRKARAARGGQGA